MRNCCIHSLAQFRWIQNDFAPESHSWAIDDVYIGESCLNYCSGHGRCSKALKCICDPGFTGDSSISNLCLVWYIQGYIELPGYVYM